MPADWSSDEPHQGFESAAQVILADLAARTGVDSWFIARRDGNDQIVLAVHDPIFGIRPGAAHEWPDSYCAQVVAGRAPMAAGMLDAVPALVQARERNGLPAQACVSVPISAPNGHMIGTLCGLDRVPRMGIEQLMPIVNAQALVLGVLLYNELCLAEQVRRAERHEEAAFQDPLTAVANRRAWDIAMGREEVRAARFGTTASVVVFDLDGLKQINDQWGHEAGDLVLVKAAEEIRQRIRATDVLARLGGDEFGLLLFDTDQEAARRLLGELLGRLREVGIAISTGLSQRKSRGGLHDAWRLADARMYEDKKRQRSARVPAVRPKPRRHLTGSAEGLASVDAVLELVKTQLGLDVAFVNRFDGSNREFRNIASSIEIPIAVGFVEPRQGSYCQLIVDGRVPSVIPDVRANPDVANLPVTSHLGIGAYVGVPLHDREGNLYGTLCAYSREAKEELTGRDAQVLQGVGDLIMRLIEAEDRSDRARHDFLHHMDGLLSAGGPTPVYQPIHTLSDLTVIGFEALSRFPAQHAFAPAEWFATAAKYGVASALELSAIGSAVAALSAINGFLALNVSPATLVTPEFLRKIDDLPLDRIVLEVTEHEQIDDYQELNAALAPLRMRGLRVAVDDAGAGFASMHHIIAIVPDFIKLDISLVRGIDRHPARQALAASLAAFAAKTNASLIAEGIETQQELRCLQDLNIEYGQGYHLSRPEPRVSTRSASYESRSKVTIE